MSGARLCASVIPAAYQRVQVDHCAECASATPSGVMDRERRQSCCTARWKIATARSGPASPSSAAG